MTATDELRKLLTECGVEWRSDSENITFWNTGVDVAAASQGYDGMLWVSARLTPEQAIAATLGPKVTGDTSDGYHTFNELYHHRAVLFSVIVRDHRELAWKSMRHHDGTMYDGMFIVGIETPDGQATYHYDIDPYWDMFNCKELDQAPEWDGHTPSEAIERIATLGAGTCRWEYPQGVNGWLGYMVCSCCGEKFDECVTDIAHYCPNCGRRCVE